jgi:hypothetical protein
MMFLKLWVVLCAGNAIYALLRSKDFETAADRSAFQGIGLLLAWAFITFSA